MQNGTGHLSQWILFRSPARAMKKSFLALHQENLVEFLEVKPLNVWRAPDCGSQEILSVKYIYTYPPKICYNYHFNVLLVPGSSSFCPSMQMLVMPFWIFPSFYILKWWFTLQPQFNNGSKKRQWFLIYSVFFVYG